MVHTRLDLASSMFSLSRVEISYHVPVDGVSVKVSCETERYPGGHRRLVQEHLVDLGQH